MEPLIIPLKKDFIGRTPELAQLQKIGDLQEASIIIMYGRRRIGKTELLEQAFRDRNILKFEGIEGLGKKGQLAHAIKQLAKYAQKNVLSKVVVDSWSDFFQLLAEYTQQGSWTIYLEELQWLANYESSLIAELKYVWDNYFRHNPNLIVILCGSAPSFMIDEVVNSKALYNRSQYVFNLKEFTLLEAKEFLKNRSNRDVLDAYLSVGGIPEYLKRIHKESSIFLGLCNNSFKQNSYFSEEFEKIFTSSMSKNKHYKKIIDALSQKKFATREELAKKLNISSGGTLTKVLQDLEKTQFIYEYHPFNLDENTILTRYAVSDNYLHYYFKFIKPLIKNIKNGDYNQNPQLLIKTDSYMKWLGFAFERFCRKYHFIIAKILGFSGIQYHCGVFFSRATDKENPGYQIDLIFDRGDKVYTICELKYLQTKVGINVINEFQKKLDLFKNTKNYTLHKVLVCNEGADEALINRAYFDNIITAEQLFNPNNW